MILHLIRDLKEFKGSSVKPRASKYFKRVYKPFNKIHPLTRCWWLKPVSTWES
jgi:hypothetical protein